MYNNSILSWSWWSGAEKKWNWWSRAIFLSWSAPNSHISYLDTNYGTKYDLTVKLIE
jgi:hypothetical protein